MLALTGRLELSRKQIQRVNARRDYWHDGEIEILTKDGVDRFLLGWRTPSELTRARADDWVMAITKWLESE